MLLDIIKKGSVDRSVTIRIIDSTDGTPETGVVFNTSGIDLWYRRQGGAKVSITEATLSALTDVHADGGFLHIGDGYYRLDLPDAAFATGANHVDIGGTVTGMIVIGGRVRLVDYELERGQGISNFPFQMIDKTTNLPATGKTVAVAISKDGGAFTSVGNATEISGGWYEIDLSGANLDARTIAVEATNADCWTKAFSIVGPI